MQWFHFSLAQKIDVSWVSSYYKISLGGVGWGGFGAGDKRYWKIVEN